MLENRQVRAAPIRDGQVLGTVTIKIEPRQAWAELTQSVWNRRLPLKIVERFFVMRVLDRVAHITEKSRFHLRSSEGGFRGLTRCRLIYLINPIRFGICYDRPAAISPLHFEAKPVRPTPRGKHSHRIVTRKISS